MSQDDLNVSQMLSRLDRADGKASEELLPIVYAELRALARSRMQNLPPGNTLQPTALVHEAFLRLVDGDDEVGWNGKGHFFASAAQAMRQILVDQVRRKGRIKHGGEHKRVDVEPSEVLLGMPRDEFIALDEALDVLKEQDERKANIVMMRFFAGLKVEEIAKALDVSTPTVKREWRMARSILFTLMKKDG